MLCAVCLQKWDALTAVAWHSVGSMFTAPLEYATFKGDRKSHLPSSWETQVPKVNWCFDPRQAGPTGAASLPQSLAGPTRGGQGPALSAAGPLTTDEWTAWANRSQRQPGHVGMPGRDKRPVPEQQRASAAMAALPTVPLAVPGEPAQEAASFAYTNEDWHTWKQQQRWRDWSWGASLQTWGGRNSPWEPQQESPATWHGEQWCGQDAPTHHPTWEEDLRQGWQTGYSSGEAWSQQRQDRELWEHYQNNSDRARGASSRAQTQGSHKRLKGDKWDKSRSKSQHWKAWKGEPAPPAKGKGRRERERQRDTAAYGRPQNEATA
eukprot:1223584-Amphidinium_carterae.1